MKPSLLELNEAVNKLESNVEGAVKKTIERVNDINKTLENITLSEPAGQWTPPEAGDAPEEVKRILKKVYSEYRDKHPEENAETKERGAKIAWAAVKNAGWHKNKEDKWIKESAVLLEAAPTGSVERVREDIQAALKNISNSLLGNYPYVRYIFADKVIVSGNDGKIYEMTYSVKNKTVIFGAPKEVEEAYVLKEVDTFNAKHNKVTDIKESREMDFSIDFVSLSEAAYDESTGEIEVILVESGTNPDKRRHYPEKTIRESASIFKGFKMYINHPTPQEERERPERNLRDWASTIMESWSSEKGGKVQARGKVYVHDAWLRESLKDPVFRVHVGLSINTGGKISMGKINGQEMQIVEAIYPKRKNGPPSVDWVTEPGARGRVAQLLESRGEKKMDKDIKEVTLQEVKETRKDLADALINEGKASASADLTKVQTDLKEAQVKIAGFEKKEKLADQAKIVEAVLKESKAPDAVKDRVRVAFSDLREVDGKPMPEKDLKESIGKAIAAELEYANKIGGKGKIKLGDGTATGDLKESIQNDLDRRAGVAKKETEKE